MSNKTRGHMSCHMIRIRVFLRLPCPFTRGKKRSPPSTLRVTPTSRDLTPCLSCRCRACDVLRSSRGPSRSSTHWRMTLRRYLRSTWPEWYGVKGYKNGIRIRLFFQDLWCSGGGVYAAPHCQSFFRQPVVSPRSVRTTPVPFGLLLVQLRNSMFTEHGILKLRFEALELITDQGVADRSRGRGREGNRGRRLRVEVILSILV